MAKLLRVALPRLFRDQGAAPLVRVVSQIVRNPAAASRHKVARIYSGSMKDPVVDQLTTRAWQDDVRPESQPFVGLVTKLFPLAGDPSKFDALCRIFSGTVYPGMEVAVLGEKYRPEDQEDTSNLTVASVALCSPPSLVPANSAKPSGRQLTRASRGMWCLLRGVAEPIVNTATLVSTKPRPPEPLHVFKPLVWHGDVCAAVMSVALEPLHPADLPNMLQSLRCVNKSYPGATPVVAESGEHSILGTGELFMDVVLHDVRHLFAEDLQIRVADPVALFTETVVDVSAVKTFARTPNAKNKLSMMAEPLDKGLPELIDKSTPTDRDLKKGIFNWRTFTEKFKWDALAARSIWAFGPSPINGPNILIDDTLPAVPGQPKNEDDDTTVDKDLLAEIRDPIVQGFQWATREGPLCDCPMRGVKFALLGANISSAPAQRQSGQIVPTARRLAHSAFLLAAPRLMEPIWRYYITTPADAISAVYSVLSTRRGHVLSDTPTPMTPLFTVTALVPVMDSFGLDVDLRCHTQGQAFATPVFDHWELVPGDPLDTSFVLAPLEVAPAAGLARDFMVKTRRRKGLPDDVSLEAFIEDPMLLSVAQAAISGEELPVQ
eukprot:NODE_381_length_2136_cov_16.408241_g305_i0.p1 GENE.NODE_381_length_2136_cov_16.408241_g305_i0~~NODE_381_length_2136_cov_16.408241_g305_i0.p1  ORF type:complete len:683 (+),score=218.39 NODE_381_length_2136_cov_16.408241_g305_i0:236-2050(+)